MTYRDKVSLRLRGVSVRGVGGEQQQINNFSSTITLIIACIGLLINSLGVSALAGIAVVACIGPLQGKLMRMAQLYRRDIAKVGSCDSYVYRFEPSDSDMSICDCCA
jgi:hypothetical protein